MADDDIRELNALIADYGREFQSPASDRRNSEDKTFSQKAQEFLKDTGLDPAQKFYLMSMIDKAQHKVSDIFGNSKETATFTEALLSPEELSILDKVARNRLGKGIESIDQREWFRDKELHDIDETTRFEKALGSVNIVGEDADNTYYEDKYDFHYPSLKEMGGISGLLNRNKNYHLDVFLRQLKSSPLYPNVTSLGAALAPLLSYTESDTRAPRVRIAVPKATSGKFYSKNPDKDLKKYRSGGSIERNPYNYEPKAI